MDDMKQQPLAMNRRELLTALASAGALNALAPSSVAQTVPSASGGPVASTEHGKVRGIAAKGVLSFRGIPYGGPAEGKNRFMPPTKATPWQGVREAVKAGPRAVQHLNLAALGERIFTSPILGPYFSGGRADAIETTEELDSENCLVLNVLTTSLQGKRPVMVYIHGGGFTQGTGALTLISDRFVAEQDIVLVGINHRLNVFGYTYLGDLDPRYADSGNVGQLDLIAALHWVKTNIANFGGDPANVTIFGESGGGAKVSCLLAMPSAKGLFHRAIVESGSPRSVRTKEAATEDSKKLLAILGLEASQVNQLQDLPASKLYAAALRSSGPLVDGRSVPHQTWQNGAPPEAAGVPLLVGNCKDEATLFSLGDPILYSLHWTTLREKTIKAGIHENDIDAIIAKYRESYPKDSPSDLYFRIAADRGARTNAIAQAQAKVEQGDDVYMYNFAWDTPISDGMFRAFHTSELPLAMRLVLNPEAEELSKQISGAWAGFARSGNPNHTGLPRWEKYSLAKRHTMIFNVGQTALAEDPAREELVLLKPYPTGLL